MSRPRISCIVTVFDQERYLAEALESVLAQTLPPFEVIVVDDASRDGSAAVAERLGEAVRVIRRAENGGHAAALNSGLEAIDPGTEFVSFLDGDDRWPVDKLWRQVERLRARPEVDFCVGLVQNFLTPELVRRQAQLDPRLFVPMPGFCVQTLMLRRSLLQRVGGFDGSRRHTHDTDWFSRARDCAAFEMLPAVLALRRIHGSNTSQVRAEASRSEYLALVKAHLDRARRRSA